jgi:hypothetical protein
LRSNNNVIKQALWCLSFYNIIKKETTAAVMVFLKHLPHRDSLAAMSITGPPLKPQKKDNFGILT